MEDQAEKLREMMQQRNGADGAVKTHEAKKPRIVTITSGKGGVGKTNISVNMALAYAQLGKKVIVMDADLGLANVHLMLNITAEYTLKDVIRRQRTMREIMVDTEYGISFVAGASGFFKIANLSDDELQFFVEEIDTLSMADIIIIDTGAGISRSVIDFVAAADDAVIVTTPEPTAITDAYGIIKIITTEIDNLDMGLKLIVNRAGSAGEAKKVADRIIENVSHFLSRKVEFLGYIYDDVTVSHAVQKRKPFMIIDPRCKASQCIRHIVGRLEKTEIRETETNIGSLFRRLFRRE